MAGREVREYTNLSDPKDKKWGKGKDKIDDEDISFQRMVAKDSLGLNREMLPSSFLDCLKLRLLKCAFAPQFMNMQEVAGERGGYLHGRGALDSDDLLYLKEQMEAEEDAERLLRRTEKRAFAAFKRAAGLADISIPSAPFPHRVEPKPKSGIRQKDLLKKVVEIKPKRQKVSSPTDGTAKVSSDSVSRNKNCDSQPKIRESLAQVNNEERASATDKQAKSLLGLAYEGSDSDED